MHTPHINFSGRRLRCLQMVLLSCVLLGACSEESTDTNTTDTNPPADTNQPDTVAACVAPQSACDGACVDLMDDDENCGNCGVVCDRAQACQRGLCTLICPDQQLACGADCVTPASNPLHCGECDQSCDANLFCSGGQCLTSCQPGETLCGQACAHIDIDPKHCGGCGLGCVLQNASASCLDGECGVFRCYRGFDDCDRAPVNGCEADIFTNPQHCGGCNLACAGGEVCSDGACVGGGCPQGREECFGGCVIPGTCAQPCEGLDVRCDGTCVDLSASDAHCGACGVSCASGAAFCEEGKCVVTTPPGITYVKASNAESNDNFGTSLALSADGHTLAVGAIDENSAATGINGDTSNDAALNAGAVYIFTKDASGVWSQAAYIKASNTDADDNFGASLALSADGTTLAVGAVNESSDATGLDGDPFNDNALGAGAVYVFTKDASGVWSQAAYIKASNTDAGDHFGDALALSAAGDVLAVGAPLEDSNANTIDGDPLNNLALDAGAVYVFRSSTGAWSQTAYIKALNAEGDDRFGASLALSANGTTLAVGAYQEDSNARGLDGDPFNNSVSNSGAAYIFSNTTSWSQAAYVKAPDTDSSDQFGWSVALSASGNLLAVGADNEDSASIGIGGDPTDALASRSGAAYILTRSASDVWTHTHFVKQSNTEESDHFARCLSLSGDGLTFAASSFNEDSDASSINGNQASNAASNAGAAYIYDLQTP